MLLGAPVVQLCTAVMWEGYGIIEKLKKDLITFMGWHGFESISDFLGKGRKLVVAHAELDRSLKFTAQINQSNCIGCGKCVTCCADAGHQAVELCKDVAKVTESRCVGCSLCAHICPRGAISLCSEKAISSTN